MTNGADEPETLVFRAERRVASGLNGRRIVLAPGSHVLRIGSSRSTQMMLVRLRSRPATRTRAGHVGGIIVEVVDKEQRPHRGTDELIGVADRQPDTVGFVLTRSGKAQDDSGDAGLLSHRAAGATIVRDRPSTVVIPESSMVYFKLVQDPDNGSLLGAGVVATQ